MELARPATSNVSKHATMTYRAQLAMHRIIRLGGWLDHRKRRALELSGQNGHNST